MEVTTDVSLQALNTMAAPSVAEFFVQIDTLDDVHQALAWARHRGCVVNVIGGGSNILVRERVGGLILKIHLQGREILAQSESEVQIRVGAGENWHDFVVWCLARRFYGLENLALIPGSVGAAPVQNIGAYGVEVAQYIERVEGISRVSGEAFTLLARDCRFGYRDSVFKHAEGSGCIITHVVFRLPQFFSPNLQYPALADELHGEQITAANVFAAVCRIRSTKLPDPAQIPNCGSFFKNPVVSKALYEALLTAYPHMPSFALGLSAPASADCYRKLAAAWLIDQAGWRGQTRFGVSVHHAQALVLTNPGRRPAEAVLALARDIQASVEQRFGVALELEPQILGG